MKKFLVLLIVIILLFTGCTDGYGSDTATKQNVQDTKTATENILTNQTTPTDISFSLERYNLIKRAYWVNGHREKANQVRCDIEKPIGYITLIVGNSILCQYTVDGKISSLNSYLSPDSDYYELNSGSVTCRNYWLADVDGSYGTNVNGIFWFDCDGNYHEWNGTYHYSDIPLHIEDPIVKIGGDISE